MTSKASSDNSTTRTAARQFPPRAQLPPGVSVESLPGFGTTWYDRGASYWILRAGIAIFTAALVALWTFIVGAVVHSSGPTGSPAFVAALIAEVVLSIATGIWQFRKIRNRPYRWTGKDRDRTRAAGPWAGSLGSLARAGSVLAGLVIVVLALLTYGAMLAVFALSLMPELPPERQARMRLAAELEWQLHGVHGPGKRKHKH
jgi:hypothetical protein